MSSLFIALSLADDRQQLLFFGLHQLKGIRFNDQPQQGLGIGGTDVAPPVGELDTDTIQLKNVSVAVTCLDLFKNGFGIAADPGVDFAGR